MEYAIRTLRRWSSSSARCSVHSQERQNCILSEPPRFSTGAAFVLHGNLCRSAYPSLQPDHNLDTDCTIHLCRVRTWLGRASSSTQCRTRNRFRKRIWRNRYYNLDLLWCRDRNAVCTRHSHWEVCSEILTGKVEQLSRKNQNYGSRSLRGKSSLSYREISRH
jgi:hypothetical protein